MMLSLPMLTNLTSMQKLSDNMNNKEFITDLAKRTQRSIANTSALVEDLEALLKSHLEENDTLTVYSFGTFEVKKKMERISVNPVSSKRYLVPPKLTLAYRQSASLKEKFNGSGDFEEIPDDNEDETVNE